MYNNTFKLTIDAIFDINLTFLVVEVVVLELDFQLSSVARAHVKSTGEGFSKRCNCCCCCLLIVCLLFVCCLFVVCLLFVCCLLFVVVVDVVVVIVPVVVISS